MTNEEFQSLVLEKLGNLEDGQRSLEEKVGSLEEGQNDIKKDIKAILDQTVELSEFRYEINEKIDELADVISIIEIVTSKNWYDISRLKAAK